MSLQSNWMNGILFQSQLLYSKTINRGPHNSEKKRENYKQEARETLWYKRHLILYKATSLRIQAFKFKNDQDQDHRIQEQARSP